MPAPNTMEIAADVLYTILCQKEIGLVRVIASQEPDDRDYKACYIDLVNWRQFQ